MDTRKPSVLHLADKFGVNGSTVCGVTRLFKSWIPRFRQSGIDANVVCLKSRGSVDDEFDDIGIDVTYLGKRKGDPSTLTSVIGEIRRFKPDILHLHGYGAGVFGRIAATMLGLPVVLHEHFVDPSFPILQGPVEFLLAPAASLAIGVSRSVAQFCIDKRHIAPERVEVVYNGAPMDEFVPAVPGQVARLRAELDLPPDARVIGALGRLHEQKGFNYLIEAAPQILASDPNARIVIVGDGALRATLQAQIDRLAVGERVHLVGYRNDVRTCLSMFDIMAMPSLFEGLPLTALEAIAQGKALVTTPVDGLGEIFEDRKSALFVPPKDSSTLAAAITELMTDDDLRQRITAGSRKMAPQFDIARSVKKIEEHYHDVLVRRAKR